MAMYFATVVCPTSMPSLSNSPWMRGAPQSGFCNAHLANEVADLGWDTRSPAPRSSFPAPIGPEASPMPTEHGLRFDDLQRVENVGSQRVHAGKHQPVDAGERQSARRLAAEHIQLVAEHENFGFERRAGPEQPSNSAPDQLAKVDHRPRASTDSRALTSRLWFPVGTGRGRRQK